MDRRIIKTKEAIQNAYIELFWENGASKITISELARKANIDRKTFYLHYDSLEDVLKEIIEIELQNLLEFITAHYMLPPPYDATAFFHCVSLYLEQNTGLQQHVSNRPDFEPFWKYLQEILIQKFVESFSEITDLSNTELLIYGKFVISGMIELYSSWLKGELPVSLDELGAILSEFVQNGATRLQPTE